MKLHRLLNIFVLTALVLSLFVALPTSPAAAAPAAQPDQANHTQVNTRVVTQKDMQAAAEQANLLGFDQAQIGDPPVGHPGDVPRYFSHPNYANSPLRLGDAVVAIGGDGTGAEAQAVVDPQTGAVTAIDVTAGGSGYTTAPITIDSAVSGGAGAAAEAVIAAALTGIVVDNGGSGYTAPVVSITGGGGTGATATAVVASVNSISSVTIQEGGSGYINPVVVFTDQTGVGTGAAATATVADGVITDIVITNPGQNYNLLATGVTITDDAGTGFLGTVNIDTTGPISSIVIDNAGSGYTSVPSVGITDAIGTGASATASVGAGVVTAINVTAGGSGYVTPGIRKFVNELPGLGSDNANDLGQYIPVAQQDDTTYFGSDYYEIAVVEYEEQMHSDLAPTRLRGYVQLSTDVVPGLEVPLFNPDGTPILLPDGTQALAVDHPHYLGPLISAQKDRPVRILFRNLLPTGAGGDLFIPVDTTVMGSGMGPMMGGMTEDDPQNPMCGGMYMMGEYMRMKEDCYSENRATLHLHGGISPWISDGTPHQWITPAGEDTAYPEGVSVQNVPDMPDPGPGAMTFFYTNQQSARLMFYHDHSWGITRLNVYAGEAAAYLITDPTEQRLIDQGVIPTDQIPLVVQDKTFVPSAAQLAITDELWDSNRWGDFGDLWLPHVYVPAQNPGNSDGVNAFGRWVYGPWFWPPTSNIDYMPVPNEYYDENCNPDVQWCEPPLMPAVPFNSMGMEAFHDTPLVNGTAYPYLTVDPKAYRFRVLNAANDRFFNLSLYQADATGTEVALNAAEVAAALDDPFVVFPTVDETLSPAGPDWIQIGTEGGFLPAPAVIPPQVTTWVSDPTVFNAGNVDKHSLLLGPAERADVIVDFSAFAGQTLILYNDAPAAFPARDPRYDYYTGSADLRDTGGAPSVPAGFGPNTRTVMQIKVADIAPAPAFDLARLQAEFAHKPDGSGVFESSQNPIIVGQGAYNSTYGTSFQTNGPNDGFVRITDNRLSFKTLEGLTLNMPLEPKAIQDEMGEAFEQEYGRMSGNLGVETPNTVAGTQQNLILYPYVNPASEVFKAVELDGITVSPISTTDDGSQLWKITHNGVDTHPIHFHLFDVQLINRVGWDGGIRPPDANELGWKDTVRVSPLEDTIVAMRPILPDVPFGVPDSIRPLNPMMPIGDASMFNSTDALGNPMVPPITNQVVNFGNEYVWHCHILSHEEMDMMRPMTVYDAKLLPPVPVIGFQRDPVSGNVSLTWVDGTPVEYTDVNTWDRQDHEIGFIIERAVIGNNGRPGAYSEIGTTLANVTGFVDTNATLGTSFSYRVAAYNALGRATSVAVGGAPLPIPSAPTNVAAVAQVGPQISITWRDRSNNESFFVLEKQVNGGAWSLLAQPPANSQSFVDSAVSAGNSYRYRVAAVNNGGQSLYGTSAIVTLVSVPAAPSGLTGSAVRSGKKANVSLTWVDNSTNETGFVLERATNAGFSVGLTTTTLGANTVSASQTGLYRGVTYFFRIRAVNTGGSSGWSNVFSVVTP